MLLYLLGALLPPLGILVYGKIIHAALNAVLWTYAIITPGMMGILLWVCASLHSSYVIHNARAGRFRNRDYSM